MSTLNETLLNGWIDLSLAIVNEKVVSELPYNESLICNILNRQQRYRPDSYLTATDLCELTRMQKSQMNRTLISLEKRGLIMRERSKEDKRQIFIRLKQAPEGPYQRQHEKILTLVNDIVKKLGKRRAQEVIKTFRDIVTVAGEVLK